ncbi:hypothetical protein CN514_05990 [Bacillus sp. AFS001701]|nr:hypothetical protein CN514_05990 [Bacillus sp. AFS001701]
MRIQLEVIRIIFILVFFVIFELFLGSMLHFVYSKFGVNLDNSGWIVQFAILILFFVIYKNGLQYIGWNIKKGRKRLTKKVSKLLISTSMLLLIFPPIINLLFN